MQTHNPPAGNLTLTISSVDWQTRVFVINYGETMQWVGYSLTNGAQLWGPTASQASFDYYTTQLLAALWLTATFTSWDTQEYATAITI